MFQKTFTLPTKKQTFVILGLLISGVLLAFEQPVGTYKEHLSLKDTFFGDESNYMVCYPKEHRDLFLMIYLSTTIAAILFYITIRQKIKSHKILQNVNKEIAQKNNEILESIRYAKRIQEAILPKTSYVNSTTSNLQVLYKPKDIVSGDFYWIHKNQNGLYIAVIDCTGHGVPGAFLSLLAHDAITYAVIEKQLTIPTEILDTMNAYVKNALNQQSVNDSQDSMEVGLCIINQNQVSYAGAGIKLKYYTEQKLHEIKAAKCSVGSVQDSNIKLPVNHTITLQKGDKVYMHSDGFADQFGETQPKKLTAKRLNQTIESIAQKDISSQKEELERFFENWKGNTEQTDDVLLTIYEI